jgi:hypothetical protein
MKSFKQYIAEVAPPGDKAERMVKHIKKGYSKDGILTKKEKGIAYATAWKAHNKGQVKEGAAKVPYREGGSIIHDGVEYDFDAVMSIAEKLPTEQCPVDKLSWVLKYDTADKNRTNKADISFPLIVAKSVDNKLTVIDGLHRLNKAVRENVKTLPIKYIKSTELKSARLNKKELKEEYVTEMDSDGHTGLRDDPYDYTKGKWTQAKAVSKNKATKIATDILNKSFKQYKKKNIKEDGAVSVGPTNVTGPQSGTDPISATAIRPNKKKKYLMGIRRNLPNV